tara:strand:+ start:167 stop:427 length:261 start_codon:yes stop_codon:yes gene_type:complete
MKKLNWLPNSLKYGIVATELNVIIKIPRAVKNFLDRIDNILKFNGTRMSERKGRRIKTLAIFESNLKPWASVNAISLRFVRGFIFL